MKYITRTVLATLALASLIFFGPVACHTGKSLEPGGAYAPATFSTNATSGEVTTTATQAPDKAFFEVDSAYDLAYSAIDAAFNFERNNRQFLWSVSPNIKHVLDDIRPKATDANTRYLKARRIYLQNPTPAGLTDLQTALSVVQNLSASATAVLPQPNK